MRRNETFFKNMLTIRYYFGIIFLLIRYVGAVQQYMNIVSTERIVWKCRHTPYSTLFVWKGKEMREILFRGKRKDNGEWVEGDSLIHSMYKKGDVCIGVIEGLEIYSVIPETIGQYTGLTDKNGKKIFEGDILTAHFVSNRSKQHFKVIFESGTFLFDNGSVKVPAWDIYCLKIIGNIHDNPELLKGE